MTTPEQHSSPTENDGAAAKDFAESAAHSTSPHERWEALRAVARRDDDLLGCELDTYGDVLPLYAAKGWGPHLIPLPTNAKFPPPTGYTGRAGADVTAAQAQRWAGSRGELALRLPRDVVALDVDAYSKGGKEKTGDDTLAELVDRLGPLPATWNTANRREHDEGTHLFRIPAAYRDRWPRDRFKDVDVIHHGHRYVLCWPDVVVDGDAERVYEWVSPDGVRGDEVPPLAELPELPAAWCEDLFHTTEDSGRLRAAGTRPSEKPGVIGAFCRAYSIADAIAAFDLPMAQGRPERWGLTDGSSLDGFHLLDDEQGYWHSGTGRQLFGDHAVNAFDLVRVLRFADDREVPWGQNLDVPDEHGEITTKASMQAMFELCEHDLSVQGELALSPDDDEDSPRHNSWDPLDISKILDGLLDGTLQVKLPSVGELEQ